MTIIVPGVGSVRTYSDLTERILDDLNNPSLTSQAQLQLGLAIRAYKSTPFWFNQGATSLSVSQVFANVPNDFLHEVGLHIMISGVAQPMMREQDINVLVAARMTGAGRPTTYCYYGNRLEFNRSADVVY